MRRLSRRGRKRRKPERVGAHVSERASVRISETARWHVQRRALRRWLIEGKTANDDPQFLGVLRLGKAKDIVLAKATAIDGEAEAIAAQVIVKFDCLIFWHYHQLLVAIFYNGTIGRLHDGGLYSNLLTNSGPWVNTPFISRQGEPML
jgi:hypothetical protein